jgi:hypothetical protein
MNQKIQSDQIDNILTKCWADSSFKQQLLADPAAVLKAEGVDIPAGYTVHVLENTDKIINYVLPPNPNAELSDSELESVAGGKGAVPGFVSISRQEMQKMGMHDATRGY